MEAYSHLIEIRKFTDKCLVCDFQVEDICLSAPGLHIQTNKWLHLEDWVEIDKAVNGLLEGFCHSENLEGFETEIFHVGGAIRVDCKKIRLSNAYKRILGSNRSYIPIALNIRIRKIDAKALMDQIASFEDKLNQLQQNTKVIRQENNNSIHNENVREYDPTANNIGTEQSSNDYVPYTASVKTSNGPSAIDTSGSAISENEPYSPKPVNAEESSPDQISESPNEIPTYKPARIALMKETDIKDENLDQKKEEQFQPTKLSRRKRSPTLEPKSSRSPRHHSSKHRSSKKLKTKNSDLFGSDDSDQERIESSDIGAASQATESPGRVATPLRHPSTSDQLHKEIKRKRMKIRHESIQSSPLDGWLSKGSIKTSDRRNGKSSKKPSRHVPVSEIKTEVPRKMSDEQIKNQNMVELQQIKELSALRDTIKSKRKSPPPEMEILSLTHLSSEDILGTFESIKPTLDEIFKTHSKKTKITGFDGINHMKTLMLIDDKKQLQMMNFLRENYQPDEKGVPSLTDLYINALVPEWTVNVFMKEFHFTRTEAIERLRDQEESSVHHNKEGLDSSGPL